MTSPVRKVDGLATAAEDWPLFDDTAADLVPSRELLARWLIWAHTIIEAVVGMLMLMVSYRSLYARGFPHNVTCLRLAGQIIRWVICLAVSHKALARRESDIRSQVLSMAFFGPALWDCDIADQHSSAIREFS